jgi:hypothetical protein
MVSPADCSTTELQSPHPGQASRETSEGHFDAYDACAALLSLASTSNATAQECLGPILGDEVDKGVRCW